MRIEEYLKPEVLQHVARLDLKAKFLMEGFLAGLHSSPFKGFSVEFSEHRRYVPGDDIRTIDWKVFARTNRYYVKQYQAETNLEATLIVDASGSMGYAGTTGAGLTKLQYAVCLAAAIGYLMVNQQDSVGLAVFDETLRELLRPKSTRRHLMRMFKTLSSATPRGESHIAERLHEVARRVDHRGLAIVMSDLLDEPAAVLDGLRHLRHRGHDVIVFHVLDADETRFPFEGTRIFQDLETADEITTDAPSIRNAYLESIQAFVEDYRREATQHDIDYILMDTATPFDRALLGYLQKRAGR